VKEENQMQPLRVSLHALCFVLGFALLFTLLGAIAGLVGLALHPYQQWLARAAGWRIEVVEPCLMRISFVKNDQIGLFVDELAHFYPAILHL
jgi:cytochrome c biogenesis protein CcdA